MTRSAAAAFLPLVVTLSFACKAKKQPSPGAEERPPGAATSGSGQDGVAQPAPATPQAEPVDKAIVDGAASADGKVLSLVIRGGQNRDEAERSTTPGFVLFARAVPEPKAALAGSWTAFRIFGPGQDRAAARQVWTFAGDQLTVTRLGDDERRSAHQVAFEKDLFSYEVKADGDQAARTASGFTTGQLLIMSQPGPLLMNPETGAKSRENSTTLALRSEPCSAKAIEGKWRAFRLGSRQLAEWTLAGEAFELTVWDDRRDGTGKSRRGTYRFDPTNCGAVFSQARDEGGEAAPAYEVFFAPNSGLALSGRGDPQKYSNAALWFRMGDVAPRVNLAGPWVVYRHPPRVGFVTMDAKGGFDGSTGNSWDEPLTPISGTVVVAADQISGAWKIEVPESPRTEPE